MKRKLLSILLALSVMLTLLPTAALAEGEQGTGEPQTPYLKMECSSQPETSFTLPSGTYEVRFYIENGPNSPYPAYPTNEQIMLTCDGAVTGIAYSRTVTGTNNSGESFTAYYWTMTVSDTAGSGSISGTLKVDENTTINLGSVTVTSTGKQAKSGTFAVQYNGDPYSAGGEATLTLPVGEHIVALTVTPDNGGASFLDTLDFVTCGGCISIAAGEKNNDGIQLYKLTVSDSGDGTGYIQYNSESNRVTINRGSSDPSEGGPSEGGQGSDPSGEPSAPTYGNAVQDADRARVDDEYDDFFYWTGNSEGSGAIAVPFTYNGVTYYLGTCEWDESSSAISPKGHGSRGLTGNDDYLVLSVRVFELLSGSASSANASYALREDIRAAMIDAGYTFQLVVRPTTIGCRYYPATETIDWTVAVGSTSAGDWTKLTFDKEHCAGCWVFEGQLWKDNDLVASSTASERMSRMDTVDVTLTGTTVEALNTQIANALASYTNLSEPECPNVKLQLPGGELTGELVIPETGCFVSLCGAGARDGKIKTTLRGGVNIKSESQVEAVYIHFVGAGKNTQNLSDGRPNSALYGKGEGIPRQCILEDYYCAVQSETRTVWGANRSIFRSNHIGIHANATGGGNLQLQNSWFVGNDIALQVDNTIVAAITPSGCCFVNNGEDLRNNCRYDLWLSGSFFYHGEWTPTLWSDDENGTITLNISNESGRLSSADPLGAFDWTNYNRVLEEGPVYECYLPHFNGRTPTYAFPLARTEACNSFFYPNRWGAFRPDWWTSGHPGIWEEDWYPAYVPQGNKLPDSQLSGGHFAPTNGKTVGGYWGF